MNDQLPNGQGRARISRRQLLRGGALLGAGAAAWLLAGCGDDDDDGADPDRIPAKVATSATTVVTGTGWPYPNYDAIGSRATFASPISSANVELLSEAWRYPLIAGAAFGGGATTPVVVDGTIYLGDLLTNVHAVDLATGQQRWFVELADPVFGPSGVAVDSGRVFGNRKGTDVAAYDATDGERLWSTNIVADGGAVNIQPIVADGVVLAATSSLTKPGS